MANEEHLKILKQGVEAWNRWREENSDIRPNLEVEDISGMILEGINFARCNLTRSNLNGAFLSKADFTKATLNETNLSEVNLSRANLIKTDLSGSDISGADLHLANFFGSDLVGASLIDADLDGVNFNKADVRGVNFSGANLKGTDFCEASFGSTALVYVDLSSAKGLETIRHSGRSYIDIHTLERSGGKIPEIFLRGCGVSNVQIEASKLHNPDLTSEQITVITYKIHELLVEKVIHYYSCFISYSNKDEGFARQLHDNLQDEGVRCWFAPEDMKIGDKIRPTIDQSIRVHDKLLIVLSEHSMNSQWVEQEVETALAREHNQDQPVLFPVRLDNTVIEIDNGWPALIKNTRHIGDFSLWKDHDAYQHAFERLLRDLKRKGSFSIER